MPGPADDLAALIHDEMSWYEQALKDVMSENERQRTTAIDREHRDYGVMSRPLSHAELCRYTRLKLQPITDTVRQIIVDHEKRLLSKRAKARRDHEENLLGLDPDPEKTKKRFDAYEAEEIRRFVKKRKATWLDVEIKKAKDAPEYTDSRGNRLGREDEEHIRTWADTEFKRLLKGALSELRQDKRTIISRAHAAVRANASASSPVQPTAKTKRSRKKTWGRPTCPSCGRGSTAKPGYEIIPQNEFVRRCKERGEAITAAQVSKRINDGTYFCSALHDTQTLWCPICESGTPGGDGVAAIQYEVTDADRASLWAWLEKVFRDDYKLFPLPSEADLHDNKVLPIVKTKKRLE